MPASSTGRWRSSRRCRILSSAARVVAGSTPRSMSLAPSSTMTASASSVTDQSRRARPSLAVFAGDAGIDDGHVMAARLQGGFELRRERLACRQAEARRQAVAEGDDLDRIRPRPGCARTSRRTSRKAAARRGTGWIGTAHPPYVSFRAPVRARGASEIWNGERGGTSHSLQGPACPPRHGRRRRPRPQGRRPLRRGRRVAEPGRAVGQRQVDAPHDHCRPRAAGSRARSTSPART